MTDTARICVDRAKDRGRASREQAGRLDVALAEGLRLRDFQKAAVDYSINCFDRGSGVLIADEMGLGKTVEAIAVAVATGAKRVLVICPASLRLNWVREIEKWSGTKAIELHHAEDVFEGPGWAVTNVEKLVVRKALSATEVTQRAKLEPATSLKTLQKLRKNESHTRAIWIVFPYVVEAKPSVLTDLGVIDTVPDDFADPEKRMIIVRASTKGEALQLAASHEGWTHVVGKSITSLAQQERAGGLYIALVQSSMWDLLIVDESHRFGNDSAMNTRRVFGERTTREGLVSVAHKTIALTGTPMPNRPKQMLPVLRSLCPSFREAPHFLMRYCGPKQDEIFVRGGKGKKKLVWSFDGGSNLPELQARLRRECMIRRKKEDVLRELPPRTRQIIPVSSREIQEVVCKENDFFFRGERTAEPTLAAMVAMACDNAFEFAEAGERLIAAALEAGAGEIATMRQEIAMAKMPICLEHIENLLTTKAKVVVMAHHRIVVETITEKLEGAVKLYGGMTDEAKAKAVDDFQNGNAPVFVGSLQAAGVGLTLTAADTMVFVEDDWVPSVIFQAEDRIHRIGQTNPVLIQHIVADGTIDAMIVQSVIAKQRMIDEALDAPKEPKRFERASDDDRAQARIDYQTWASEDSGVLQTSDSTKRIVNEIAERCERRPPTDGEVSLWKRLRSKARSRS